LRRILCIETSTDICSVCIAEESKLLAIKETERSYSHSEVITLFIEECLKEANLTIDDMDAVAVSSGPGSYTALRIGSSTAKGICYAKGIPLISVDTIKSLGQGIISKVAENDLVIPLLDARRKEVYHAVYDSNLEEIEVVAPKILDETSFKNLSKAPKIHFCGDGVAKAKTILKLENAIYHEEEASSRYMIKEAFEKLALNNVEDIAYYTPFYFKPANITVQKKNILR